MDGPPPPRDISLCNIIDKLAEFVARNGPEFEMITKQKQQGNPKFEFLYGGEYANYYQYRVAAEHAFLKQQGSLSQAQSGAVGVSNGQQQQQHQQQQQQMHHHYGQASANQSQLMSPTDSNVNSLYGNMNMQQNVVQPQMWGSNQMPPAQASNNSNNNALAMSITAQIEAINMQQNALREQILQSESNLSAQHSAMMAQQKSQIEEAIEQAQNDALEMQAEENGISLKEFDGILQPIVESCTKDSISAGKNWILQHSADSAKNNVVLQYLLKKALINGSTFTQKLHLIYLVNDILHHCVRKNANDLKNSLENVVIPMFCSADLIATPEQRVKLTKLLALWESKAKFFDACVISKLQSPDSSMQEYKTNLQNKHHDITTSYTQSTKATLDNYQKQHQIFIQHATQQIAQLEQQKQLLEQQILSSVLPNANTQQQPPNNIQQQQQAMQQQQQQQQQQQVKKLPALMSQHITMPTEDDDDDSSMSRFNQHQQHQNNFGGGQSNYQKPHVNPFKTEPSVAPAMKNDFQTAPPNFFIPDLSKPPPGFLGGSPAAPVMHQQQQQHQPPQQQHPQQPQQQQQHQHQHHNHQQQQHHQPQLPHPLQQQPPPQQHLSQQPSFVQSLSLPAPGSNNETSNLIDSSGFDILAANAAIQILQQHQKQIEQQQQMQQQQLQQQLQSQQQTHVLPPSSSINTDDELLPINQYPSALVMPVEDQKPSAPYYDLPAGLMVPLILLEDYKYKPLNPDDIRLPPPAPQNERLTNALAAFYSMPSHDRPRDTEGWEKLALYEYYKVKNAAKKQKEDDISNGLREKSRSPTPIILEKPKLKKVNKRCYRSKSRSRSRTRSPYRSRSRTPPPVRTKEKARGNRYSQRNRSPRRSPTQRNNERDRERNDRNDRDRDRDRDSSGNRNDSRAERSNNMRRDRERSITPPNFYAGNFTKPTEFIEETNKGHQMLMKMGWAGSGTGLGNKGQGIDTPISGGEVRDRKDMFKGVGVNLNDPFENFRKNKGAAFVHRMRSRDDKS